MLLSQAVSQDLTPVLAHFAEQGYARLGVCATPEFLVQLRERIDDIMLGRVPNDAFFFQHDSASGRYEDLSYGKGFVGPSLDYRKVERLERDPLFWAWTQNALFERVAHALIDGPVTLYRALLFGKSAAGGTELPWHQDGGVFWGLDREPFLQFWTALDDAPLDGGCLEAMPGTHKAGLTTPDGGVVQAKFLVGADERAVQLPALAGEVIMIHNHMWHRSQRNRTGKTRRAFTVALLDGQTKCLRKKAAPRVFRRVF